MREGGNTTPAFPDTDWREAIDALVAGRHAVLRDALPEPAWRCLRAEAEALHAAAAFAPARVGRAQGRQRDDAVRGDSTCWLNEDLAAGGAYLRWMDGLRRSLNRELFLGLAEFEAHYAHYPPGAFYRRHVDRHRDSNARVVSAVFYLNPDWRAEDGGELRLEDAGGSPLLTLSPQGGTLLLFMSDDMPHEVLAAARARWSIAGWFRSGA
jgi:SM-20-related protein